MPTATATLSRPALLGGPPAVTLDQTEAQRWPIITAEDEQEVLRVLRSGQLSISQETTLLETAYRAWLGAKYAIAHCNGTSALLAAMHALGVEPGDEVIVPSATWWASVMPILWLGGVPVFAESEDQCIGLDPADVERKITPRTRLIVAVHLFGMPSRMNELLAIARARGVKVLEDASHAHGAVYHGRKVGTLGDAAVFSMQANKLVPSAEGGMFLTNDTEIWEKALRLGHYEHLLGLQSPNRRFAATGYGFKFRMSPLSAALARSQFKRLEDRNHRRNSSCIYLSQRLEELGCFHAFLAPPGVERVYFEFLVRYNERAAGGLPIADLGRALKAEGALVAPPRYPLLHQQPMFTDGVWATIARFTPTAERPMPVYRSGALPRTEAGNRLLLKLPSFPSADRALLDQYALAFEKVIAHAADLPRGAS
jgi:dTDP-4-amino-4,6-dideoxygalactose transaminase